MAIYTYSLNVFSLINITIRVNEADRAFLRKCITRTGTKEPAAIELSRTPPAGSSVKVSNSRKENHPALPQVENESKTVWIERERRKLHSRCISISFHFANEQLPPSSVNFLNKFEIENNAIYELCCVLHGWKIHSERQLSSTATWS